MSFYGIGEPPGVVKMSGQVVGGDCSRHIETPGASGKGKKPART